jgi:hypothetical protein
MQLQTMALTVGQRGWGSRVGGFDIHIWKRVWENGGDWLWQVNKYEEWLQVSASNLFMVIVRMEWGKIWEGRLRIPLGIKKNSIKKSLMHVKHQVRWALVRVIWKSEEPNQGHEEVKWKGTQCGCKVSCSVGSIAGALPHSELTTFS